MDHRISETVPRDEILTKNWVSITKQNMRLNSVALKPFLIKAFTSHSTLGTKRGAKIPRGNQQLKTKQAVKNRFGIRKLHSLPLLPSKVSDSLVWRKWDYWCAFRFTGWLCPVAGTSSWNCSLTSSGQIPVITPGNLRNQGIFYLLHSDAAVTSWGRGWC